MRPLRLRSLLVLAALAASASGLTGQSATDRTPNLGGGWVGPGGQAHFNFLHRFTVSDPPARKVANSPTFLVALGLPFDALVGARYATASGLVDGVPNEWEYFGRVLPLREEDGAPVQLGLQAGYNLAAASFDGEVSVARTLGPVRLLGAARAFSDAFYQGEARVAVAGGAVLRITDWLALAGDAASLVDRADGEDAVWGAGVQLRIPYTPHSLSLHATNAGTTTLQGASVGSGTTRYGFTFNVPVTLRRYFGRRGGARADTGGDEDSSGRPAASGRPAEDRARAEPTSPEMRSADMAAAESSSGMDAMAMADTVHATIEGLEYRPGELEVTIGTTIVWTNNDPLAHTVTAGDDGFDSDLIQPGDTWSYTFTEAGTFPFHCTPHPFMTGTVTVRDPDMPEATP